MKKLDMNRIAAAIGILSILCAIIVAGCNQSKPKDSKVEKYSVIDGGEFDVRLASAGNTESISVFELLPEQIIVSYASEFEGKKTANQTILRNAEATIAVPYAPKIKGPSIPFGSLLMLRLGNKAIIAEVTDVSPSDRFVVTQSVMKKLSGHDGDKVFADIVIVSLGSN